MKRVDTGPNPPDGTEGYTALDGSFVEIPPVQPLPDGPMPVFGEADYGWL